MEETEDQRSFIKRAMRYGISEMGKRARLLLGRMGLGPTYFYARDSYLRQNGWFRSLRLGLPVGHDGSPIPWFTYPAVKFIEKVIKTDMKVFEYGCGNSTLWWAGRVSSVVSCEHDPTWHGRMEGIVPPNVSLFLLGLDGGYSDKISEYENEFDIVVIDGRNRVDCAINSVGALKEDGVIIWDNSERERYSKGFEFLKSMGFRRLDFEGMGAMRTTPWCTTVFYRSGNCLGI